MAGLLGGLRRDARTKTPTGTPVGVLTQRNFDYVAASATGLRHKGRMQAVSAAAVSAALQEDGWMPLSISEASRVGLNSDLSTVFGGGEKAVRLSVSEAADFFRQAAELLAAGVAMLYVLDAIGQESSPKIKKVCTTLSESLSAGVPLSEALNAFPDAFDDVTRAYIASGETSGTLPQTMSRLATSMEKRNALRLKIRGVTAYPKIVAGVIGLIVFGILRFLVPMYERIYASFDSELPAPTRLLVTISQNLLPVNVDVTFPYPYFLSELGFDGGIIGLIGRIVFVVLTVSALDALRARAGKDARTRTLIVQWGAISLVTFFGGAYQVVPTAMVAWTVIIALFAGARLFVQSGSRSPRNARIVDRVRFRVPIFGAITRLNAAFQWATTLSGALGAGVPLARALTLAGATAGSRWYASLSEPLQNAVLGGRPLSEALADHPDLFPPSVRAMVATGEVTGDMGTMFDNIARTAQGEVDAKIAGLSAKVEVMLLVVMGIVVGSLLVALYLPILNLAATAQRGGG